MTTPTNDPTLLRGAKKFLSFSECYTDVNTLPSITELYLTQKEGFFIKDLLDLEMKKMYFNVLSKLDVSENIISKLVLKSFLNLRTIIATKNMIKEVNLILPKLMVLDLSYNFLTKVFDLSYLPCLKVLNLSNNLIEKVSIKDFQMIKFTLTDLFLDNNKINFEANEFLSFIEGLKIFNIVKFSLEGNDFIQSNKSLTYSYNLFIVATITSLKNLNNQDIIINRDNLNLDAIKNQILAEDESIQLKNLKKKNIEKEDKPKSQFRIEELKDLEDNLNNVNKNFDNVLKSGGKNQKMFFTLMDSVNFILNSDIKDDVINDAIKPDTEFIGLFNLFLMNCLLLIEMNESHEITVLNPVAQFSLFGNGKLCDKCFDFFESLIKSSPNRTENILLVFESIILKKLEETNKQLPFNCLKVIIKFFLNTKISFSKLYKNLINVIMKEMKSIIFDNCDNPFELIKEGQKNMTDEEKLILKSNTLIENIKKFKNINQSNEKDEEKESVMNDNQGNYDILKTCLDFVTEYWKIPENALVDEDDVIDKFTGEEEKEDDEDDLFDKLLQEDVEVQNENYNNLNSSLSNDRNITLELFELCVFTIGFYLEYLDNFLNMDNGKFDLIDKVIILGISLCQNIEKHIRASNIHQTKQVYIKDQFTIFNVRKAYGKDEDKEIVTNGDGFNIIETLSSFIQQSLGGYLFSQLYFYEYTKKYYSNSTSEENSESSILENEKKVRIAIANIIHLFGGFIKNTNDNAFKELVDEKGVSMCFQILTSNNNDPFILTGTCKFFYELLNYPKIMGDQMSFSKIMTKITNLKTIINYIDYENIKYRQVCDSIHKFDPSVIINNNPVAFEKVENENILELIEFIVSLIAQICLMANRVGAITTQCIHLVRSIRDNKMFLVLGNCLKINNDNVRRSVVNCIYYNDHTSITNDIIKQIINIIGTYSSVSEGDTEIILSTIYLILNKIMNESNDNEQSLSQISDSNITESIKLAMNFLLRNTDRHIVDPNELDQKNSLSASLLIYMNTCSASAKHWLSIERKEIEEVVHGSLYNDYVYYSPFRYIPIEIERTYIGNYIGFLFEIMKPTDPVFPYSYVFLRLLIKIGDVLMNIKEAMFPIDYSKEIEMMIEDLKNDLHKREFFKIENERKNWYEFERLMKYESNEKDIDGNKKEKRISYIKELNEDDHFDQQLNFVVFFPNILTYLMGKTSFLVDLGISHIINQKIDKNLISCENIYFLMEEYNKTNIISNTELLDKNFETTFLSDYKHLTKTYQKSDKYKFSNFVTNYLICSRNNITYDWHYKKSIYYGVFHKDLTEYSLYGIHNDSKRFKDEENHNNPHLRSLIISAFLRCIYTILVSPYKLVRYNFMEIVLNNNLLKDIIFLSDITLTFEYNIHYKIFSVIQLLFSKNNIKIIEKRKDNLRMYRNLYYNSHLVSVFISKILHFYHEMNVLSRQNLEISFCKDIISCLKEFINYVVFLDLEKIKIDMEFTRYWILQNVAKPFIFDIFFYILNEIVRNVHLTLKDLSYFTIENLSQKNASFIKNQILGYMLNLEQNIYDIRDILAFFVVFYPSSKEYIFNHILKAYINTKNIEEDDQSSKGKKSEAAKTLERVLLRSQIIQISYNLSKELEEFVDYMDICEYFPYPQKKSTLMILTLTETKLMLFEKKEEHNNISLGDKIEYNLQDLESIFLYDYYNRIILVFKNNDKENDDKTKYNILGQKNFIYFSLFFKNLVKSLLFVENLKNINEGISMIYFNTFQTALHKILEDQKTAIIEKISIQGEDIIKDDNDDLDDDEPKFNLDDFSNKYSVKNKIYSFLNPMTDFKFNDFECFFVISLNYKTLIDHFNFLNILYDDSSLVIDNKKVLCVNRGFLYIFRENFDKFNLTIDDVCSVPDDDNVVSCNSSEAYDLLILIKIKNISEVLVDENKINVRICYKIGEKSDKNPNLYLEFSFSDNFEFYSFCYYMNLVSEKVKGIFFNKPVDTNMGTKENSDPLQLNIEKNKLLQTEMII